MTHTATKLDQDIQTTIICLKCGEDQRKNFLITSADKFFGTYVPMNVRTRIRTNVRIVSMNKYGLTTSLNKLSVTYAQMNVLTNGQEYGRTYGRRYGQANLYATTKLRHNSRHFKGNATMSV